MHGVYMCGGNGDNGDSGNGDGVLLDICEY